MAHKQRLPLYSADQVYASLVQENPVKKPGMEPPEWLEAQLAMLKQYQVDLNYKTSAWDRLETETNLSLLSLLLMEWLEHLKTPVIDKVTANKIPTLVL